MTQYRRLMSDSWIVDELKKLNRKIDAQATKGSGDITIADPETGVETIIGNLPDGSFGLEQFVGDTTPPPVATPAYVTAQPGSFVVTWDGLFSGGELKPRDFVHVNVIGHKMNGAATVMSVPVGVIRLVTESVLVTLDVAAPGESWQFSLEAEDYSGNKAAESVRSPSVVMMDSISSVDAAWTDLKDDVILATNTSASAQAAASGAQGAADAAKEAADKALESSAKTYRRSGKDAKGIVTGSGLTPSGMVSVASDGAPGGLALQKTGTSSNNVYDMSGIQDFNPDLLYRISFKIRVVSDSTVLPKGLYVGILGLKANGTTGVTVSGTSSWTQAHYFAASGATITAADGWKTYTGYFKGHAASGNGGMHVDPLDPGTVHTDVRKIVPLAFLDYLGGDGVWEVGSIELDVITAEAQKALEDAKAAQDKADQAFNNAATAADAAGDAQDAADGKARSWYTPTAPAGTAHNVGDMWFDPNNGFRLSTWNGTIWQTTQDAALAQQVADSKGRTYTQNTTPPVEARLPQNLWIDTSTVAGVSGLYVTKYWDGSAWTPLKDKDSKAAQDTADAKGITIYSSTSPAVSAQVPQNLWIDTTGGINIHKRWVQGSGWVVVSDSRISSTATAVTAADAKAQSALDTRGRTYTQGIEPPVEARLPQNLWIDTGAGVALAVTKYWNGSAWTVVKDAEISAAETRAAQNAQAKADAAAIAAINAQAYSKNASFDDWPTALPAMYLAFGTGPTKETSVVFTGANAARFNCTDTTTDRGLNFNGILSHAPNLEYYTVEITFRLESGTSLNGAGVLLDWVGLTNNRASVSLSQEVPAPVTGKWYTVSKTLRRPTNATGTFTGMDGYLMANYSASYLGTVKAVKDIVFDWVNIRPSTAEEILAYGTTEQFTSINQSVSATQLAANGKNKVHYDVAPATGTTDPTNGNLPYIDGDTWYQRDSVDPSKIKGQWEFLSGAWVPRKITGLVLTELDAGTMTVGFLRGENLSATAIDGKTVTGALIQTTNTPVSGASARGIKLTPTELMGFEGTTGNKSFSLTSGGTLAIKGEIKSGSTITGATLVGLEGIQTTTNTDRGVKMDSLGIKAWDGIGQLTFSVNAATGEVEAPGIKANSIKGAAIEGGSVTADKLVVQSGTNLIPDPGFLQSTMTALRNTNSTNTVVKNATTGDLDITNAGTGSYYFRATGIAQTAAAYPNWIPVVPGEQYYFSALVTLGAGVTGDLRLTGRTKDGTATSTAFTGFPAIVSGVPTEYIGTVPANCYWMLPEIRLAGATTTSSIRQNTLMLRQLAIGKLLVDGAIDGKTITGALIQSTNTPVSGASARGIKLTETELMGFDGSGNKNFSLTSAGALTLKGTIQSGSSIQGALITGTSGLETSTSALTGVKISNTGIKAYDAGNNLTFHLDATTGYLEVPGIKANSLKGDRLEASSVSVDKLYIMSMDNMISEPTFLGGGASWANTGVYSIDPTGARNGGPAWKIVNSAAQLGAYNKPLNLPVEEGQSYRMIAYVKSDVSIPVSGMSLFSSTRTAAGASTNYAFAKIGMASQAVSGIIPPNTWVTIEGTRTIPAGHVSASFGVFSETLFGTAGNIWVDFVSLTRMGNSELIVDGSVKTKHMLADTIDGGIIKGNTLSGIKLIGKSIETDKLVVSSTDNLVVEADFGNGGTSWTTGTNQIMQPTGGRSSGAALRLTGTTSTNYSYNLNNKVTVDADNRFRISMWVKTNVTYGSDKIRFGVKPYSGPTANAVVALFRNSATAGAENYVPGTNVWTQITGITDPLPAGTTHVEFFVNCTSPSTTAYVDIDAISVTRASDGNLIVDGAIDGKVITGATIQTAASGSRIVLDDTALNAWNTAGDNYFNVSDATGVNISSKGKAGYSVQRANYCTNPSMETSIAGWTSTHTETRDAALGYVGTSSLKITHTATADRIATRLEDYLYLGDYRFSAYVRHNAAASKTITAKLYWVDNLNIPIAGGTFTGTATAVTTGTWTRLNVATTGFTPANAFQLRLEIVGTAFTSTETLWVDAVMLEHSSTGSFPALGTYFDGNTTDTSTLNYVWSDVSNLSISYEQKFNDIQIKTGGNSILVPNVTAAKLAPGVGFIPTTPFGQTAGLFSSNGQKVSLIEGGDDTQLARIDVGEQKINMWSSSTVTLGSGGSIDLYPGGAGKVLVNGNMQILGDLDIPVGSTFIGLDVDPASATQVTWANGWTNFGSGYGNLQAKEIMPGVVLLQGMATPGTRSGGITIAMLPVELRPNRTQNLSVNVRTSQASPNANQSALLQISTTGDIKLHNDYMSTTSYAMINVMYFITSP